uniref:Uncharacterized protein n=1 Tax=Candidatus Kentrum sp. MB TaxID=2138164 RepID=A0A450XHT8_9GAMM|nr:MAG: hypothetical protein BECKMB1821G_GA0114241_100256 [Candidatus Kentron sp. MB]VFK28877.1 MAG: hypothetical protein BECKMB1821I_GA0114274_100762 [Candidatus Kentron sp. MB]VFK74130.1 MAG: hypothetical protein BECKMB1821H_GA0114242_100161 [Candidatus Kentron sp. MB]
MNRINKSSIDAVRTAHQHSTPPQPRQHPITRLALAGLVHGHGPEFQTHAARLVGKGGLQPHGRVQPGLGIAFPALDFVGHLAAFVGLFP